MKRALCVIALAAAVAAPPALARIEITEWMYNGDEFIELRNMGNAPVHMSGWSFDDDSRIAGAVRLSAFGTLAVGESAMIAESAAADFRNNWALSAKVKVIGGNGTNLGRSDEINIFDATGTLFDRFTYSDRNFPGTIRTLNINGNPTSVTALSPSNVTTDWVRSAVGDIHGSYAAVGGVLVANPASFEFAPVTEHGSYALMLTGGALVDAAVRHRRILNA